MRIVYIAASSIPSRTANSIHVMKMCQAFAKNGHDVFLIIPDRTIDQEAEVDNVFDYYGIHNCFKIIRLPWYSSKIITLFSFRYMAVKQAGAVFPDLVYSRDLVSSYLALNKKLPVIFESHDPASHSGLGLSIIFKKTISNNKLLQFVVISESLKEHYIANKASLKGKILVAPDGADPVTESTNFEIIPNALNRLQVGYIGHLYPGRGIDIIKELAKWCLWADFHIVGGNEDDIIRLKEFAKYQNNFFVHGHKSPKQVEKYRLGCDVLIAPYQKEVTVAGGKGNTVNWMSPLKIFEYMAAGKAIICSDIPVLREILIDEKNALLCSPEDVDSWKRALMKTYIDKEFRYKIGEKAKKDFLAKYTWEMRANNIIKNLNKV